MGGSKRICCVVKCQNTSSCSKLDFYSFPILRLHQRNKWLQIIRTLNGKLWMPNSRSVICGQHFVKGKPSRDPGDVDYVPSIFIFQKTRLISRSTSVSMRTFALQYVQHAALLDAPCRATLATEERQRAYAALGGALAIPAGTARAWERRLRAYLAQGAQGAPGWAVCVRERLRAAPGAAAVVTALCDAARRRGALCSTALYNDVRRKLRLASAVGDLHAVWVGAQRVALAQAAEAARGGDAAAPPACSAAVADLLLLHTDVDTHRLVTDESLRSREEAAALHALWRLVLRHRLEEGAPPRSRVRAQRWSRARRDYLASGRTASLVVLQRRWHELKLQARERLAAHWRRGGAPPAPAPSAPALPPRPAPLHLAILKRYPCVAAAAFDSWRQRVQDGRVVTESLEEDNEVEPAQAPRAKSPRAAPEPAPASAPEPAPASAPEPAPASAPEPAPASAPEPASASAPEPAPAAAPEPAPAPARDPSVLAAEQLYPNLSRVDECEQAGGVAPRRASWSDDTDADERLVIDEGVAGSLTHTVEALHSIDPSTVKTEIIFESDEDDLLPCKVEVKDEIESETNKDASFISNRIIFADEESAELDARCERDVTQRARGEQGAPRVDPKLLMDTNIRLFRIDECKAGQQLARTSTRASALHTRTARSACDTRSTRRLRSATRRQGAKRTRPAWSDDDDTPLRELGPDGAAPRTDTQARLHTLAPPPEHPLPTALAPPPEHQVPAAVDLPTEHPLPTALAPPPEHQVPAAVDLPPEHQLQAALAAPPEHQLPAALAPPPEHQLQAALAPPPEHQLPDALAPPPEHQVPAALAPPPEHQLPAALDLPPEPELQAVLDELTTQAAAEQEAPQRCAARRGEQDAPDQVSVLYAEVTRVLKKQSKGETQCRPASPAHAPASTITGAKCSKAKPTSRSKQRRARPPPKARAPAPAPAPAPDPAPTDDYAEWQRQKNINAQYFHIDSLKAFSDKKTGTSAPSATVQGPAPGVPVRPALCVKAEPASSVKVDSAPFMPMGPALCLTVGPAPCVKSEPVSSVKAEPACSMEPEPVPCLTVGRAPCVTVGPGPCVTVGPAPCVTVGPEPALQMGQATAQHHLTSPAKQVPPGVCSPGDKRRPLSILEEYARTLSAEPPPPAPPATLVMALVLPAATTSVLYVPAAGYVHVQGATLCDGLRAGDVIEISDTDSEHSDCSDTRTRATAANTRAPAAHTRAPAAHTRAPAAQTRAAAAYTSAPAAYTRAPTAHTSGPPAYTRAPAANSRGPASYTRAPTADTRAPAAFTRAPAAHAGKSGPAVSRPDTTPVIRRVKSSYRAPSTNAFTTVSSKSPVAAGDAAQRAAGAMVRGVRLGGEPAGARLGDELAGARLGGELAGARRGGELAGARRGGELAGGATLRCLLTGDAARQQTARDLAAGNEPCRRARCSPRD